MKIHDDFDDKYTYDDSIISNEFDPEDQKGMLETFGPDYEKVIEIAESDPMRLWTAIDCDSGIGVIQGWHYVNRVYYIVTKERAETENEFYLIIEDD